MKIQTTFKRYEIKYLLSKEQKEAMLRVMEPYMSIDAYGRSSIRNVYYDTDTYRLIRASLEKPVYKEKLRVRSYGEAGPHDKVFVELKKKYNSIVYKRRLTLPFDEAVRALQPGADFPLDTQIAREIRYVRDFYETLHPAVFLSYEREAFYEKDGGEFRVTFDDSIHYRTDRLCMHEGTDGTPILGKDQVLMELKAPGAIPLWMTQALTSMRIFRTSFSKYGRAYLDLMTKEKEKRTLHKGDPSYA